MARISAMVRDKKTGRLRRKSVKAVRTGKKGARKRGHHKTSAATKRKIAIAVKKTMRTGKTKAGRRRVKGVVRKRGGGARAAVSKRGKVGRPVGYKCSKATRAKMSKSAFARWGSRKKKKR